MATDFTYRELSDDRVMLQPVTPRARARLATAQDFERSPVERLTSGAVIVRHEEALTVRHLWRVAGFTVADAR